MKHMILGNFHPFNYIQMNVISIDVAKLAFKILNVCYGKKDVEQAVSSILLFWKILCFSLEFPLYVPLIISTR